MELTTKQKAHLRGLAQTLRPQLHVGHEGLNPGVRGALEDLFKGRELVKGRVLKTTDEKPYEIAQTLANECRAGLVGVIGKTFVLYRPNPDLKERIELPTARPESRSDNARTT
jgi:RNA-binding protein